MAASASPVDWLPDGTPHNRRFNDIYRTRGVGARGGLAQARHVFLGGCNLPEAWRSQARWIVLETGFGLGLNFLATWLAWRSDTNAPTQLHYVAVEAWPPTATDILRSAADFPELLPLAEVLCAQWQGLLPGFHRMSFEDGQIQLTLCIGEARTMLREQQFEADSLFLDGFNPATNPDMWDIYTLKAASRLCRRGTRVATWTVARSVRDALAQSGFVVEKVPGLPPKRECLRGQWAPAWNPRRSVVTSVIPATKSRLALVVGAGLAGASTAFSLAQRGWQVVVLDRCASPATGASGLPAGLIAPHVSSDDRLLSRLTRSGVSATLERARNLLHEGVDWQLSGLLEHQVKNNHHLPLDWLSPESPGQAWSGSATADQLKQAGLPAGSQALWHRRAGWVRPAALVQAMLAHPGVTWRGNQTVAHLLHHGSGWQAVNDEGEVLAEADLAVVAAGYGSLSLLKDLGAFQLPLRALRGQVTWAPLPEDTTPLPPFPVNGSGSFINGLELGGSPAWILGSTFERDCTDTMPRPEDAWINFDKLATLLPGTATALRPEFTAGRTHAWAGVRCTVPDRLPVVGALDPHAYPGLLACTAMGARGISLGVLCGELLAAQIMGEPLPVPLKQAHALAPQRWLRKSSTADGCSQAQPTAL